MPPLHRMPLVYVFGMLVGVGVLIGTWWSGGSARPLATTQPAQGPDATPPPPPPPPPAAAEAPEPESDGILRTPEGLRRKVLVRELGLTCRDAPDVEHGRPVGEPLDYFSILYLYGESPDAPGSRPWVQVGTRVGPPLGWVPADAVLEWDTRVMALPTSDPKRPPLVLYQEESCLRQAVLGQSCPRHLPGKCPTEGEETERPGTKGPLLGMPILASGTVAVPGGAPTNLYRVASLVHDRPPPPTEPTPELQRALRHLYLAFVVDTTGSMQAYIDAVRKTAEALVDATARRYKDMTLHLALVEYRDEAPEYEFRARRTSGFTDPVRFRKALKTIRASDFRDGSVDEAVLDGVAAALPARADAGSFEKPLAWPTGRAGELATKMIVLVGDAPDHAQDLRRTKALAAAARRAGITIAAVEIQRPGLSRLEQERYQAQWRALAEGSYRPRPTFRALARQAEAAERGAPPEESPPLKTTLTQAGALVPWLEGAIADRVEHARDLVALLQAEQEKKFTEYRNRRGLSMAALAPILNDLHHAEPQARARPDPSWHGQRAPSVRLGWIADRAGSARLVALQLLMSHAELATVVRELGLVQQAAQRNPQEIGELLEIGTAAAAGETSFLAADRGSLTFADHLRRRAGLPPARTDSLLRRSQSELLQADDLYRSALNAHLGRSLLELIRLRDAPSWDSPNATLDGMGLVPYELFDF